jgi:hypothetical protein
MNSGKERFEVSDKQLKQLKGSFKKFYKDPIDLMEPIGHCLNSNNCGNNGEAFYHINCLKYKCKDYKPRHTKNAKILEKIKAKNK